MTSDERINSTEDHHIEAHHEMLRFELEQKIAEVEQKITEGHPDLIRLKLRDIGRKMIELFDELPRVEINSPEFWELDSSYGAMKKEFDALWDTQPKEDEVISSGFIVPETPGQIH